MAATLLKSSTLLCPSLAFTKSTAKPHLHSNLRSLLFRSRSRTLSLASRSPSTKPNDADSNNGSPPAPEVYLYNTMSISKEMFKPRVEGRVGMYVCGVIAYDLSHIEHARVYVTFDVLYRGLLLSKDQRR
ncbi:uncharacterized protein A4U43_C04F6450 [Asparagus officinalis]|uniref:tRNA synthetases class I catalytic domain-containing protein n=1 Tax=Asparagus officinalis TaxID=4686 RepID=A0A5P1EYP3_ASPOF|nr:uncharacterized protein LOC109836752 [Asparagus officinalis]ONK71248.1 uncharacterized protein A4U43_C04F6450 [Asparagus officinalis]